MRVFDGKKTAEKILEELKEKIKEEKLAPRLAVILVGEDEASKIYIRLKKEAAERIGVVFELYKYDATAAEEEIIKKIKELNQDRSVSGIIVQLPLPAGFSRDKIIGLISPLKDVDGFHQENQQLFATGKARFEPVLPTAILFAIKDAYGKKTLKGQKAIALVNSDIFGQVLKVALEREGIYFDYILRKVCLVAGVEKNLQEADIIITVCGCPNLLFGEMIKQGAVLIDAGIFRTADGKITGDINHQSVKGRADFLTPVPGGLGPLVIAFLLKNVYVASRK